MKFSIVVPVFNVENYIEECVQSVLDQTYQDFELVLIDDGSIDKSGIICDRYAQEYPDKIKVVHNENQGQFQARLCGVRIASGEVCLFVDSDDCIRIDSLEILNGTFEKTECDLVLFNASTEEKFREPSYIYPFEDGQIFTAEEKKAVYEQLIDTSKLNSLCLKAVKMEIIDAVADDFSATQCRHGEDLLYSLPLVTGAKKICYLNQNLYFYRQREGSVVHTYNPVKHRSIKIVHQEMEKYIDRWGMQEYHPKHFAREVRGWVDCLKKMLIAQNKINSQEMQPLLKELAEDDYFRNAYQKMTTDMLTKTERILARWLYEKKYAYLKVMGFVARNIRKIKK